MRIFMKKYLTVFKIMLVLAVLFSFSCCSTTAINVNHENWADDVKTSINDFLSNTSENDGKYAVFDFDNTSAIFDVEEQLAIYQLKHMAFAISPEELPVVLKTQLSNLNQDLSDLGYGKGSYNDWITDITKAYSDLYQRYEITAAGLDERTVVKIQQEPMWKEFATKMRAMYDLIFDNESADVAYPWITYWFTGMTEQEVYDLAFASHSFYSKTETYEEQWNSPTTVESLVGPVSYKFKNGIQVTDNVRELMKALDKNGIDVWVCSASALDVIRAAIDAWGLHDYVTGVLGMINKIENGVFVNEYDYSTGYGWLAGPKGKWAKDTVPEGTQTQGPGKVTAISNVLVHRYGKGPSAGFMDSTGDFNFCTEFASLELVVCFNRADRKVTDGGGLIAELAIYQKDYLNYNYSKARKNNDTLYVLQGRDENGLRSLRPSNYTIKYGETEEKLFRNSDNYIELEYFVSHNLTTEEIINNFSVIVKADDENSLLPGIKYGFLKNYPGYHSYK